MCNELNLGLIICFYGRSSQEISAQKLSSQKPSKLSSQHAIHSMVKSIRNSFNEDTFYVGIFLDIKIAFDSLDRNKLLQKLKYYGIVGIIDKRRYKLHFDFAAVKDFIVFI